MNCDKNMLNKSKSFELRAVLQKNVQVTPVHPTKYSNIHCYYDSRIFRHMLNLLNKAHTFVKRCSSKYAKALRIFY